MATKEHNALSNIGRSIAHLANTFEGGWTVLDYFKDEADTLGKVEVRLKHDGVIVKILVVGEDW